MTFAHPDSKTPCPLTHYYCTALQITNYKFKEVDKLAGGQNHSGVGVTAKTNRVGHAETTHPTEVVVEGVTVYAGPLSSGAIL